MRSHVGPALLLVSLLALFGGGVYLTHHPESEIVRRAESWPFVGPLASALRERLAPSPPPPGPGSESEVEEVSEVRWEPVVPPRGEGRVWVLPGHRMRSAPSETSPTILQFERIANVIKLTRRGDWYRIWYRGSEGWVYLEGYDEEGDPPYGRGAEPLRPLPPRPPDPAALEAARLLLDGGREIRIGPWTLYTDSVEDALLARLDAVANQLEAGYVARYGLEPLGTPASAVVLYADEDVYRQVQDGTDRLLGLAATGHTASGLALLYTGRRDPREVTSTLVHELVHTINRRAIGPALPSWLDEGLAEDVSISVFDAGGRLAAGSLDGVRRREGRFRVEIRGGLAALWKVRDGVRSKNLPTVRQLLALDWEAFVRPGSAPLNYSLAGFWIRFLLDAEEGRHAGSFRAFLAEIADGGPATGEALREKLETSWSDLDTTFRRWVESHRFPGRIEELNDGGS